MIPTVGRIVWYTLSLGDKVVTRPAIITQVYQLAPEFTGLNECSVDLETFGIVGELGTNWAFRLKFPKNVFHSEEPLVGTWRWPPKV